MSCDNEKAIGTERFFGVYLLCSQSPEKRFNGKCYVGFTVNPNRRINQHNRGLDFGGAKKTNNKGPWKMVMIIHGFPNKISALQFEWAWQQPSLSTRLSPFADIKRKKPKETYFQYNFRILSRMLSVGPWNRLPLIIQWLESDYECDFEKITMLPPSHMNVVSGRIDIKKPTKKFQEKLLSQRQLVTEPPLRFRECHLCGESFGKPDTSSVACPNSVCNLDAHLTCLANHILVSDKSNRGHYIPIAGRCPICDVGLSWAELLQNKRSIEVDVPFPEKSDSDIELYEDEMEIMWQP